MFDAKAMVMAIFLEGALAATALFLIGWGICALVRWIA